mmetsp:Transcript_38583/g.110859  ORF Transcript_38583/g.110859 Transcript_38583/m.110859 type:complete len:505 (-) Transcript_38583:27-1541(-)
MSTRKRLITVRVGLEGTFDGDSDVVGLFLGKFGKLGSKGRQVKHGNLLVQGLGKDVDLSLGVLVAVSFLVQFQLSKNLICERARHDERRMASGTSQVKKTSLGKDNDSLSSFLEDEFVDLGLDVDSLGGLHQTIHINFVIEVTDVSNDGVVLHLGHVFGHQNSLVTSSGDENIGSRKDILQSGDSVSFHAGLKGTDGVDLGNVDDTSVGTHGMGASLTDISVSADDSLLTGKHDIGGTHDTIGKRVLASVQVVELGLGNGVVDVDGSEKKGSLLLHGVKTVDTSSGLLGNSMTSVGDLVPLVGFSALQKSSDDGEDDLKFSIVGRAGVGKSSVLQEKVFGLLTLVDKEGHVTTVIDNKVGTVTLAVILGPGKGVQGALPVFFKGLSLPSENGGRLVAGDGSSGVVLGGENVARAPTNVSSKFLQSLNKDGGLDGHVQGSRNTSILERLGRPVLGTAGHKSRHFDLSKFDILATVVGKRNISDCRSSLGSQITPTRGEFIDFPRE